MLTFTERNVTGRVTKTWIVTKEATLLGEVSWWSHWRRYVFHPAFKTLFDVKCLVEIIEFIEAEMAKRKTPPLERGALVEGPHGYDEMMKHPRDGSHDVGATRPY